MLSLGCQHAQIEILRDEIRKRDPNFTKPLFIFEQQKSGSEAAMMRGGDQADVSGPGRGEQGGAECCAAVEIVRGVEVRRVGRIFGDFGESGDRSHLRSAGRSGGTHYPFGISRAVRRRAGTDRSRQEQGSRRPVHATHARLRGAGGGGPSQRLR